MIIFEIKFYFIFYFPGNYSRRVRKSTNKKILALCLNYLSYLLKGYMLECASNTVFLSLIILFGMELVDVSLNFVFR